MNMRQISYLLTSLIVFFILALLPVIPVISAPVVPNPAERMTWVSLWQILFNFPKPGLRIRLKWFSWIAILLLVGTEFFIRRVILRNFFTDSSRLSAS